MFSAPALERSGYDSDQKTSTENAIQLELEIMVTVVLEKVSDVWNNVVYPLIGSITPRSADDKSRSFIMDNIMSQSIYNSGGAENRDSAVVRNGGGGKTNSILKPSPSLETRLLDNLLKVPIGGIAKSDGPENGSPKSMKDEAWEQLTIALVKYKGQHVGTIAAIEAIDEKEGGETLNYNQVFVRDLFPSALACLTKTDPDVDIVKNFLLKTLHLQGSEKRIDNFTLGEGVMPASFKVIRDPDRQKEIPQADFGGTAIGRVAPDSGFWWITLLRSYTKCTHDYSLSELPEVLRGMKHADGCSMTDRRMSDGFDSFPTLLRADGCSMTERRMGIYGCPIEIQAPFFFPLRCAKQLLKPEHDGKELFEQIDKWITALSYQIKKYYWLDFTQLNNIYSYITEEYSHTAVNKFNVIPEAIPDWVFEFMPLKGGYFIGKVSLVRMDFRWFFPGICIAQATDVMDLTEGRWEDLIGEMPLKIIEEAEVETPTDAVDQDNIIDLEPLDIADPSDDDDDDDDPLEAGGENGDEPEDDNDEDEGDGERGEEEIEMVEGGGHPKYKKYVFQYPDPQFNDYENHPMAWSGEYWQDYTVSWRDEDYIKQHLEYIKYESDPRRRYLYGGYQYTCYEDLGDMDVIERHQERLEHGENMNKIACPPYWSDRIVIDETGEPDFGWEVDSEVPWYIQQQNRLNRERERQREAERERRERERERRLEIEEERRRRAPLEVDLMDLLDLPPQQPTPRVVRYPPRRGAGRPRLQPPPPTQPPQPPPPTQPPPNWEHGECSSSATPSSATPPANHYDPNDPNDKGKGKAED